MRPLLRFFLSSVAFLGTLLGFFVYVISTKMEPTIKPLSVHRHSQTEKLHKLSSADGGKQSDPADDHTNNTILTIAPWHKRCRSETTKHWFIDGYGDGAGEAVFEKCKQPLCRLIPSFKDADAVLLSHIFLQPLLPRYFPSPPERSSHQQKWVFFSLESPQHLHVAAKYLNMFNTTYTYRKSSDIYFPYGKVVARNKMAKIEVENINWTTKGNIAWVVSHCHTQGGREAYVSELSKWIDVTTYGRCGTQRCPQKPFNCYTNLQSSYKFFLSFENSLCKDYASEKLFQALNTSMIPIVYGLYDYKNNLPENSFIDVRDFSSPKALADYLWILSRNRTLYETYFRWKQYFQVDTKLQESSVCDLCEYLHVTRNNVPSTVNLTEFWGEKSNCVSARTFLRAAGVSNKTIREHGFA